MVNYLCTLRGSIGTGEEFSHSIAATSDLGPADTALAVRDAWVAADTAGGTNWGLALSSQVTYTSATAAVITDLSTGALDPAAVALFEPPAPSGSGVSGPFQTAVAVSLTGGLRPNGSPIRGRFYLPLVGIAAVNNGRLPSSVVDAVVLASDTFLTNLSTGTVAPAVWSRSLASLTAVTSARVGDVPDTIRSRRNALAEAYAPLNYPLAP